MNMIDSRLAKLRALMQERKLDSFVLIVSERSNSESCHYISGFRGSSAGLIITLNDATLITDGRYTTQAKLQSNYNIIIQSKISLYEYIANAVKDSSWGYVGFEAEKISYHDYMKYFAPVKANWVDSSDLILTLRRCKDSQEIEYIKQAAKIGRQALANVLKQTRPGMTEIEFDIKLNEQIKLLGAEKGWAHDDFIVASGERGAMCHAPATMKKFAEGDIVTVDYGAMFQGYMSDITRNFALGHLSGKAREINNILLEAHNKAAQALRPGISGFDVDLIARKVIESAGY